MAKPKPIQRNSASAGRQAHSGKLLGS